MADPSIEIQVTENGPYQITGDLPITPKRMILSDDGDPITWATGDPIPHDSPTWVCRCGKSSHKPFCDGTHETWDFDGTETAETRTFAEVEKVYEGAGLTVHRVGRICQHASFCANKVTDWYKMLPDTDDVTVRGQVIGMVEHCPSGALVYELNGEINEPDLPVALSPVEDGPYWVTGRVTIKRNDGQPMEIRNRVTLCRCGFSKNKPLCDGTHKEIGFTARLDLHPPKEEPKPTPVTVVSSRRRILVGVGDNTPVEVYQVAARVVMAANARLEAIHVRGFGDQGDDVVTTALDAFSTAGIEQDSVGIQRKTGDPAMAFAEAASETHADLIIVGRGGERLSKVPHQISYQAPCDVLLIAPGRSTGTDRYRRILIATDGSATADRAAKRGYALARAVGAEVDMVFVGHPSTGELITADTLAVCGEGVDTEIHLLQGDPVEMILGAAASTQADLVVVGNKGLSRTRMMVGASVPGGVLAGAKCDVLLCRTVRQLESELEPGEGGIIVRDGEPVAAYVDEEGALHLMSAKCTHLGCTVAWDPAEKHFECPCHGSQFSPLGEVVAGPAAKPLRPIEHS